MTLYKIIIDNRNYETWTIVSPSTLEPIILDKFNPKQHKLFNNDVFTYNGETVEIVHSSKIKELLAENKISENTIVYNTSVSDQKEFNNWEQELKNTWLSKYHVKV